MYRLISFFSFLSLIFIISSCTISNSKSGGSDHSGGKTNEILVVTNTDVMWRGEIGEALTDFFGSLRDDLPQPEPLFSLAFTSEPQFNSTKILKKHHNIFIANIDPKLSKSFIETKEDLWSIPQRVVKINAKDQEEFFLLFNEYKEAFLKMFDDLEIERTQKTLKLGEDVMMSQKLAKKFGIKLLLPAGFQVVKEGKDFAWLRQSVSKASQDLQVNFMIYTYPYTDTNAFNPDHIIAVRDSVCKEYVSGPSESSYVKTATKVIPPVFNETSDLIDGYALETQGLWELEGDFMGGPFLSYTFVNPNRQEVVTMEGFIYNPNNKKAVYLRQVEAMMKSVVFSEE